MQIADLETYTNPTVGLAAKVGQVDIRIAAKASTKEEANKLIDPLEIKIRDLLGDAIYGVDQDSLEDVALNQIKKTRLFTRHHRSRPRFRIDQKLKHHRQSFKIWHNV